MPSILFPARRLPRQAGAASLRSLPALLAVLLLALACAHPALAHRVNIFAVSDGTTVSVECRFSRSSPARKSLVTVLDVATGEVLQEGRTDETGCVAFPLTERMRRAASGLRFHVNAGEGHQNDFVLEADELGTAGNTEAAAKTGEPAASAPMVAAAQQPTGQEARPALPAALPGDSIVTMTREELEALVAAAVDRRVAPLKRMLAAQTEKGPGMVEILGGIGWILGIFGAAALVMARRRP